MTIVFLLALPAEKRFAYIQGKVQSGDLWLGLFREVAQYGQERDTAKLEVKSVTPDKIVLALRGATSLTQNGITWTFAEDREVGTFCNGEYWVKGPVTVVAIRNNLHAAGFKAKPGQDGSMINPGTTAKQGYDSTLNSYDESLNAGPPNRKPVATDNPLVLRPNQTLISMVSWL